jgi:hypothetical protein
MKIFTSILLLFLFSVANSQDTTKTPLRPPFGVQWVQTMGTSGHDYGEGVQALPDGGYVICGVADKNDGDFPSNDTLTKGFVSKYDQNGGLVWKKLFPRDDFYSIRLSSDGEIIVFGENFPSLDVDSSEICLLKIGLAGELRWRKTFTISNKEYAQYMRPTSDGGAIFTAQAYFDQIVNGDTVERSKPWVVKINNSGDIQWQKFYADTMRISAIMPVWSNSRYAIIGSSVAYDTSGNEVLLGPVLGRLDINGNITSYKRFNYSLHTVRFDNMVENKDSSVIAIGSSEFQLIGPVDPDGSHGSLDVFLQKFDKNGNQVWRKYFGGKYSEAGTSIMSTDTSYYFVASSFSTDGNLGPGLNNNRADGWIAKTDSSGKLIWQQRIGGSEHEFLDDLALLTNQDIVVIGDTESEHSGDVRENKGSTDILLARIGLANSIAGSVFLDINNDGIRNPGEQLMNGFVVNSVNGPITRSSTTINGWFQHSVDTGTFITSVSVNPTYFTTRPLADTVNFTRHESVDTVHFALQALGNKKDLQVSLVPLTPARPGFGASYRIVYKNVGNSIVLTDTVQLIKDSRQTFGAIAPAANTTSGDTLRWFISSINPLDSGSLTVNVTNHTPPALTINDTLVLKASIAPVLGDENPADNTAPLRQLVTGSYDPNDKTEMHSGYVTPDEIATKHFLTYLIRFQNTGTDTAINIHVRDTLDSRLDWSTFEMITASHPHTISITDHNKLNWSFNNIFLPDSNINEPKSHGYIAFRIKPKSDWQIGDSIKNKASIYFDFNLPVITNTSHTVLKVMMVTPVNDINRLPFKVSIFPNPANSTAVIKMEGRINGNLSWRLVNMNGSVVMNRNYGVINRTGFNQEINVQKLAKGIYFLTVNNANKAETYKIVVQ